MKKPNVSKTELAANHPLALLDRAAADLLPAEVQTLWRLDDSVSQVELARYLRTALLQAYYGIADYDVFTDHVKHNSLFQSFIGDPDEEWNPYRYKQLHDRWTIEQELRKFLLEVVESVTQLPIAAEDDEAMANCNKVEERLLAWVDRFCPKAVYFKQFSNPPIKRFFASVVFRDGAKPQQDVRSLLTENVAKVVNSKFPKEFEQDEESEFGIEELMFLSPSEEQSLFLSFSRVSLSSNPGNFESWEDSVKPYLVPMIDVCNSSSAYEVAAGAMLQFGNVINLPPEIDIADYFHMIPRKPPQVVPPRLMREENLSYAFPTRLMRGAYTTDLLYDTYGQLLRCSYEISATSDGLKVELDLESHWSEPFEIGKLSQVYDELKNNLYVAFHSLITDRTRDLFE